MASSNAILHAYLKEAFAHKNPLNTRDLLEFSRGECGLLKMVVDPANYSFASFESSLKGSDAILSFEDKLYYANQSSKTVREIDLELDPNAFKELKNQCSYQYKIAKGKNIKFICAVTGRPYAQHRSSDFLGPLNYYLSILDEADEVLFAYMSKNQKDQLKFDLNLAILLLMAQQQHELDYQKTENTKVYEEKIRRGLALCATLDPLYQEYIGKNPEQAYGLDEKPVKYLGIALAFEFGAQLIDFISHISSKKIKEIMGAINEKRLYWVWGSTFLKTVIDLIPSAIGAATAIRAPDPYTGNLSWILYYLRFTLNLFLLLKHTIKGPWMSAEEAKMPWTERFQTQWDQRKFTLLNDLLWGTANLLCYFWLIGKNLSVFGDALTVALLVFDVTVAIWDFEENKTLYLQDMQQFDKDINELNLMKKQFLDTESDEQLRKENIYQLEMQLDGLRRARAKRQREWYTQELNYINNIAYALALMLAFVILTMPFMPIAAPVAATLGLVGAILCLAFTVINNALKGAITLYETYQTKAEAQYYYQCAIKKFNELDDSNEKKLLFLKIEQLEAETKYQSQMLRYQSLNLVRSIILELLTPVIILSSLVLLPLSIGVATMGAALGLAIGSYYLINALFKPEDRKKLEPFDGDEYKKVSIELKQDKNVQLKRYALFKSEYNEEENVSSCIELIPILKK